MAALPHYVPNYSQYYQYRSDYPYYLRPGEVHGLKKIPQQFISPVLVSDTTANLIGLPFLLGSTAYATHAEYKRRQAIEEAKSEHMDKLNKFLEKAKHPTPALTPTRIPAPQPVDVFYGIDDKDKPGSIEIGDTEYKPRAKTRTPEHIEEEPLEIDFKVPHTPRLIRPGTLSDKTLDSNVEAIMAAIKKYGYDSAMNFPEMKTLAGYELFTPKGLRLAAFTPTQYIPNAILGITSKRVAKFLSNKQRMPLSRRMRSPDVTEWAYRNKADTEYKKMLQQRLQAKHPDMPYQVQETKVSRKYNKMAK